MARPSRLAKTALVFLAVALIIGSAAAGESMHVAWTAALEPKDVRAGESAQILIRAKIAKGFHIYAFDAEGPTPTQISLPKNPFVEANGEPIAPKPIVKFDEGFEKNIGTYPGEVVFAVPIKVKPNTLGKRTVKVVVQSMACDSRGCDPPAKDELTVTFEVQPGAARADRTAALLNVPSQPEAYQAAISSVGASPGTAGNASGADDFAANVRKAKDSGIWAFMLLSFIGGLVALLTPCVFPMIPITVSFFSKRTGDSRKTNFGGALAYCLGIISTFSALGLIVTLALGPTGVQDLATNAWVNFLVFAIFVALALSLFGLFEIAVPAPILTRLGSGAKAVGIVGPLLMGLTFSLTSFTCTVPIVGTLLAGAAVGEGYFYPLIGMIAFSTAFCLPFFFLALFPDLISRLPRSGAWLGQVKIFMGFLELAAALKFLSNIDLVWQLGWLTQPVFLAIWAALAAITGLQLLGLFRLGNEPASVPIGPGRRLFGLASLAGAVYCLAGIQGASLGELAAFLPPDPYPGRTATSMSGSIVWHHNYQDALRLAKAESKPMFLNFTGVTCTNCRWMEKNMFPRPEVSGELAKYVAVELFTDRATQEDNSNRDLQRKLTGVVTLPVYVLLSPDEKVLKVFQGSTRNAEEFVAFLKQSNGTSAAKK